MLTPVKANLRHILFVDDNARILEAIRHSLVGINPNWVFSFANSVDEALRCLQHGPIDVIITDVTMPVRDGFDLMHAVSSSADFSHIPVLVLTGLDDEDLKRRALDAGAFDLIGKPVRRDDLVARIRSVLRTKEYEDSLSHLNATLEQQVAARTRELETSRTDILLCLAMAGECRDSETGHHLLRVARYAKRLAEQLGLPPAEVDLIFKASPLHDIGKLGIPDNVLLKPGPLNAAERAMMQRHCEMGHKILTMPSAVAASFDDHHSERATNPLLQAGAEIALSHHEQWDGSGYPHAKSGEAIPLAGRIVAVADVYDALTSRRPYKLAISHAEALKMQAAGASSQFDERVIEALQRSSKDFDHIRRTWSDASPEVDDSIAVMGTLFATS